MDAFPTNDTAAMAVGETSPWSRPAGAIFEQLGVSYMHVVSIVVVTVLLLCCVTRFYLSIRQRHDDNVELRGAKRVEAVPYWFPLLGNIFPLALDPESQIMALKEKISQGIVALNLGGTTHNMVFTPSLMQEIFQQRSSHVNSEGTIWFVLTRVFAAPARCREAFVTPLKDLHKITTNFLMRGENLAQMTAITISNMNEAIPNLVSFNDSPIDQDRWERVCNLDVVRSSTGDLAVEVSLFPLMREFMAHVATPSLVGSAFLEYCPTALQDIWAVDLGFRWLCAGLPRWLPIRAMSKAHQARARLNATVTAYEEALDKHVAGLDPGPEWRDLDDVSPLMWRRRKLWHDAGVPPEDRAPAESSLIFAMNSNANPLTFWLLLRILAHGDDLVSRIRDETAPFVNASQPAPLIRGMNEPAQLKMDVEGLVTACPLIKSCYFESLRLHSAPWSLKKVIRDFILPEGHETALDESCTKVQQGGYALKAGEFLTIPHTAHHSDPHHFESPENFDPERFIVPGTSLDSAGDDGPNTSPTVSMGELRPYGGGEAMCKGRIFAERESLAMVAGILALWEFEPVDQKGNEGTRGGRWRLPGHTNGNAVYKPVGDLRVRIRRRELSQATGV